LFEFEEGDNFNHPSTICRTYGAGRNTLTLSISRINPPKFGGGLKIEPVDKFRSSGTQKSGKKECFAKVLLQLAMSRGGYVKPNDLENQAHEI